MFPSASIRRIAAGLLEAADVALRPVEAVHPHQRAAAVQLQRRAGTVAARAQACTCPIARRGDVAPGAELAQR